jgi:Zn-dependent M28 family amino/carboxypeptidase
MTLRRVRPHLRRIGVGTALLGLSVTVTASPAGAADNTALGRTLAARITADGVNRHLIALQRFADQNGGTRLVGTPGHDLSARYIQDKLTAAGYDVQTQEFTLPVSQQLAPPRLARLSPDPKTFAPGTEVVGYDFSGSGDVTGTLQAVDLTLPPTAAPSSTSGCEAADFAGFVPGNVALIQRGTCTFEQKTNNAKAAGATAVIIFNEGQPGRTVAFAGTLTNPNTVPVVGVSFAEGNNFAEQLKTGPVSVHVVTSVRSFIGTTRNVIAQTKGGRADNVVMAGAHLDSVAAGPGINDNGSGAAALLELALKLSGETVNNKVRFAFWSGEEEGLVGSTFYVDSLSQEQQFDIALYLNFDMIASPNWARFLYDGDDSDATGTGPGPFGSAQIEQLFTSYYAESGKPVRGTDFDGRSDYGPFIAVGIPAGGIFTGAEGIKTADEAAIFGGTAGVAYDHCYHQACDNLGNPNRAALGENSKAVAFAVGRYALDTSDINGVGAAGATAASKRAARAARAGVTTLGNRG